MSLFSLTNGYIMSQLAHATTFQATEPKRKRTDDRDDAPKRTKHASDPMTFLNVKQHREAFFAHFSRNDMPEFVKHYDEKTLQSIAHDLQIKPTRSGPKGIASAIYERLWKHVLDNKIHKYWYNYDQRVEIAAEYFWSVANKEFPEFQRVRWPQREAYIQKAWDLMRLSVKELRDAAKSKLLLTYGNKRNLVLRLVADHVHAVWVIYDRTSEWLKYELRRRGLLTTGSRDELIARLKRNANKSPDDIADYNDETLRKILTKWQLDESGGRTEWLQRLYPEQKKRQRQELDRQRRRARSRAHNQRHRRKKNNSGSFGGAFARGVITGAAIGSIFGENPNTRLSF